MACPICTKAGVPAYRPFCSKRCADVDLARWLRGDYVIPGSSAEDLSDMVEQEDQKNSGEGLDSRANRP